MPVPTTAHVLILESPQLARARLPLPDDVVLFCPTPRELVAQAQRARPSCIVLDGERAAGLLGELRLALQPPPILAVVGAPALPGIDWALPSGDALPGELARLVRFATGQALRAEHRVRVTLPATVELDGRRAAVTLLDLSEGGAALADATTALGDASRLVVRLGLHDGGELVLSARRVRSEPARDGRPASLGLRFVDMDAITRGRLRALVMRLDHQAPPPTRAPLPTASRPRAVRLVGHSHAIRQVQQTLTRVAATDVTVLLLGETGTGKEMAARTLYEQSARADRPFVAVNCAALPENLVESELFGHEAGAFTGATRRKVGRLEQATGGTLFLDEIGDLPAGAQAKLLRALQERVIERVGGTEPVPVDIRLIAATNQDLDSGMARKSFRRDLFFRLNVVSITLPPLRERGEDVLLLTAHFLARAQERMGKRDIRLNEHAAEVLRRYPWPGNVRELENVCTRLVALSDSGAVLGPEKLGLFVVDDLENSPLPSTDLRDILDFCEREIVRRMLDRNAGNRTRTARELGISRQALQQKLARFRGAASSDDAA